MVKKTEVNFRMYIHCDTSDNFYTLYYFYKISYLITLIL